jgi:hypothetical protein
MTIAIIGAAGIGSVIGRRRASRARVLAALERRQ